MSCFGIDLGTTNSCLARYDEQRNCSTIITNNNENAQTIASVVAFEANTTSVASVGKSAKAIIEYAPERGIQFVKRSMGIDDIVLDLGEGAQFRPQDISALILKQIKAYGKDATQEEIDKVVVTVPAYFGYPEREATRKAVTAAGMDLQALIDEPTAAALSYFENYSSLDPVTVFVYDLGGGTFDVSAVKMTFHEDGTQNVEVLTFDGNHRLGGMDWDNELFRLVLEKVEAEMRKQDDQFVFSDDVMNTIHNKIEDLKKHLSNVSSAPFRITINGTYINVQVTREEFESRTAYLLEQTKTLCKAVLSHPKMKDTKVDKVLLVGGSTLMPMVQDMVNSIFPEIGFLQSDPHHAVAKGACIACYKKYGDSPVYEKGNISNPPPILPVVPKSVGFRLLDLGTNTRFIDTRVFRGEKMTENGHLRITIDDYGPVRDNQANVTVAAYELNNDDVNSRKVEVQWADDTYKTVDKNNNPYGIRYMGELVMPLEPGMPAHTQLRLIIDVSSTGLHMECYNLDTNGEHYDVTINMVSEVNEEVINNCGLE